MDIPILIGVGGTGQTVLAAYLRLANMAGFTPAPFYIVDSDTEGPLGHTLTTLKGGVREVVGGKEPALRWMVDPFPAVNAERKTFGGLFGNLVGDRRDLFSCLFSDEAEQTTIRTGMYGRPAIGATCIRYKILQNDDDLQELKNFLRGGRKHVILVGSCFGGTGSGGVPMLAAEFARLNDQPGYSLQVDAMIFLPWFRLVPPDGGVKSSERNLHEHLNQNFEPNAAAGINYFKDELRKHVETIFLLGVQDPSQIDRTSSESSQLESAHILNLLAAVMVQNHFTGSLQPPRGITGYWYDEEQGISPESVMVHRDGQSSPLSLLQVIHRAYLKQHWLGLLSTFFRSYSRLPESQRPIFVSTAVKRLMAKTLSEQQVVASIAENLQKRQVLADENLAWIRRMEHTHFFPFSSGNERVQSDDYDRTSADPLTAVGTWCDDPNVVKSFRREDFRSPDTFSEKFSGEFLAHLTEEFKL